MFSVYKTNALRIAWEGYAKDYRALGDRVAATWLHVIDLELQERGA